MAHGITWFEIPVTGWNRAKKFYQTLLKVDIEEREIGQSLMGILGTPEDGINGALVMHEWYIPSEHGVLLYLDAGKDLNLMLARAEGAGATVLIPKTQISEEIGYMAVFRDTEGNRIALHSRS
ncbi:MAG: VOC family protein [Bacteroidetes bacterium]|nr:VOC family protein [Bacteroidota bacterium]